MICGEDEVKTGRYIVKDLATRESREDIPEEQLALTIRNLSADG